MSHNPLPPAVRRGARQRRRGYVLMIALGALAVILMLAMAVSGSALTTQSQSGVTTQDARTASIRTSVETWLNSAAGAEAVKAALESGKAAAGPLTLAGGQLSLDVRKGSGPAGDSRPVLSVGATWDPPDLALHGSQQEISYVKDEAQGWRLAGYRVMNHKSPGE